MRILAISLFILLNLVACTKETGVPGPQGPQGVQGPVGLAPTDTGSISGKVSLYNEFSILQPDFSGAVVTLRSGNMTVMDTCGFLGDYHFHGIPIGTYNLSYEYHGYGTYWVFGLSHIPSGIVQTLVQDVSLLQVPVRTAVVSLSSTYTSYYTTLNIYLDTTSLSYIQYYQNFMVLIGNDTSVGPNHYVRRLDAAYPDAGGGYTYSLGNADLLAYFQHGDTAYVRVATYNRHVFGSPSANFMLDLGSQSFYADPATGDYIYPNMSLSTDVVKIPL
ncbi:MAG: hypothetical protein ACHQEM_04595 [Chitinophagales bacterium]